MEVLSPSTPNGVAASLPPSTADPILVLEHIAALIQTTLGAARRELEAVGSLLSKAKHPETLNRCARFASESQVALYAQKDQIEEGITNGHHDSSGKFILIITDKILTVVALDPQYTYTLSSAISFSPATVASVAFLKRPVPIDNRSSIASQIQVINLPGLASLNDSSQGHGSPVSPFEVLHSFVHLALSPYFDAYTRSRDQSQRGNKTRGVPDGKSGVPGAKKKIAELEMSLLHLQQNIEIPALNLSYHEVVQAALDEAEAQNARPSLRFVPAAALENSNVINSIQNNVNGWIRSIQSITKMSRDAECESAAQEINFWLSMESALEGIEGQLRSDGVQLTLEVLKNAKRIGVTLSFQEDTGLKDAVELVQKYNQLLRDFPLDELLSATSLDRVPEALNLIFAHLNRKLRITPYPIRRALALVEGISGDLNVQLHRLLHGRSIMHLDYRDFSNLMQTADAIWNTWKENVKEFTDVARDITRRRNEKFIPIKISPKHAQTQDRLNYVNTFRNNHEQLQRTIVNVLGPQSASFPGLEGTAKNGPVILEEIGDVDAVEEVAGAYAAVKDVDVLDVSPEGTQLWVQAETAYSERTSRVENSIIARLRDRLATAKTANEMFRVFSKFNALLVRPKVRGAIGEYQAQLLDNVKRDIASLHERFKQQYGTSEAQMMAQLHDLPPVAGSIIWVRQIERQLDSYMKRVEAVLGQDWTLHTDGEKLRVESDLFRQKLTTRHIYEAWLHDVQKRNLSISGRLFDVHRNRAAGNILELVVNFDAHVISLFKEVRNLTWLNYQIPHSIANVSKEAKRVYPYAMSLIESVSGYLQISKTIFAMPDVASLLTGYHRACHYDGSLLYTRTNYT
jgi:dynein heavy chain 1, cytosolic